MLHHNFTLFEKKNPQFCLFPGLNGNKTKNPRLSC